MIDRPPRLALLCKILQRLSVEERQALTRDPLQQSSYTQKMPPKLPNRHPRQLQPPGLPLL